MKEFKLLETLLLFAGVCGKHRHWIIRTGCYIQTLATVVIAILYIGVCVFYVTESKEVAAQTYLITFSIPYYTHLIIFVLTMRGSFEKQLAFLRRVIGGIASARRKELQSLQILIFATILIVGVLDTSNDLSLTIAGLSSQNLELLFTLVYASNCWPAVAKVWLHLSFLLPIFIIKSAALYELSFLHRLHENMLKTKIQASTAIIGIQKVSAVKQQAMSLLGGIPVQAITCLFMALSGIIIDYDPTKYANLQSFISETVTIAFYSLCFYAFCTIPDACVSKASKEGDRIIALTCDMKRDEWLQIVEPLHEMTHMEYETYGLFYLNVRLLASFLSALVTFAALLSQVLNDAAQSSITSASNATAAATPHL